MISARNTTTLKDAESISYRDAAAVLKGIASVKVRNASNVLKTVFSPGGSFTVDVTPYVYGAQSSGSNIPVTTDIATATPVGGTAPYAYAWSRTDVNLGTWTIISPTSASTAFRVNSVGPAATKTATFECLVTDAQGRSVTTIEVEATAENFGDF